MSTSLMYLLCFSYAVCCCLAFAVEEKLTTDLKESRVLGGQHAAQGQFPWHAIIGVIIEPEPHVVIRGCGGAIIDPNWILTTGTCIAGLKDDVTASVVVGMVAQGSNIPQDPKIFRRYNSTKYVPHNAFDPKTLHNNIGLIKVNGPITFDKNINRIELSRDELQPDTDVTVSGIGDELGGDDISDYLSYTEMKTLRNGDCQKIYNETVTYNVYNIYNEVVCAQSKDATVRGICALDLGGPLVVNNGKETVLVGVASAYNANGCTKQSPSLYTRIAPYVDWIDKVRNSGPTLHSTFGLVLSAIIIIKLFTYSA